MVPPSNSPMSSIECCVGDDSTEPVHVIGSVDRLGVERVRPGERVVRPRQQRVGIVHRRAPESDVERPQLSHHTICSEPVDQVAFRASSARSGRSGRPRPCRPLHRGCRCRRANSARRRRGAIGHVPGSRRPTTEWSGRHSREAPRRCCHSPISPGRHRRRAWRGRSDSHRARAASPRGAGRARSRSPRRAGSTMELHRARSRRHGPFRRWVGVANERARIRVVAGRSRAPSST